MTLSFPFEDETQPPPDGYASWLDYAVRFFSARDARSWYLFDDRWNDIPLDAYTGRVQAEYRQLRERAPLRTVYLVRHGQSLSNTGGIAMEHAAIPLTETGLAQPRALVEWLPQAPSMIGVSPFVRARQTAEPYCTKTGLIPKVLHDLHEFDAIDPVLLAGMTGEQHWPIADGYWAAADPDQRIGTSAETFREFKDRVASFRATQMATLPDGAVLFGHGIWIGMLIWQLMGFRADNTVGMKAFRRFQSGLPLPNGALYRVTKWAPGQWMATEDNAAMHGVSRD